MTTNQNSGRGSKSIFSLNAITSAGDIPSTAKMLMAVVRDGVSVAEIVDTSIFYQSIPVSINFPKKYYDISFYNDLRVQVSSDANLVGDRMYTHNITRDLVVPLNFTGSRATLESPASTTITVPMFYAIESSATTTLGTVQFNPGDVNGLFSSRAILPVPYGSRYLINHPTSTANAQGLAITLNHNASISGFETGQPDTVLTDADLVSINTSISILRSRVSSLETSVESLNSVVDVYASEHASISGRITSVQNLILGVSGVPAITSAQADISELQAQRVSINNKISATSASLYQRIVATSASLKNDIVDVRSSISSMKTTDQLLATRIDTVSALLSGVSGVPAITSIRDLTTSHIAKFVSVNNKISTVSVDYVSRISTASVALSEHIANVSAAYDTSVVTFTDALLSISAVYENKTILVDRSSPVRLFWKGGMSKNGRGVNVIQMNAAGPVSIVTSGVSGQVIRSRGDLFTSNGQWSAFGILQISANTAVAAGDLI